MLGLLLFGEGFLCLKISGGQNRKRLVQEGTWHRYRQVPKAVGPAASFGPKGDV